MTPFWLFIDGSVRWKVHIFNVKCLNLALSLNEQAICNSQDCACTAPHSTTQFLPLRVRREGLEDPNDKTKTNILNNNTATVITSTFLLTIQRVVIHLRGESPTCYSKLIIQTPWRVGIGFPVETNHVQARTGQPPEKIIHFLFSLVTYYLNYFAR